jgi:hypothetical protein
MLSVAIRAIIVVVLASSAYGQDLSRWHEVNGGQWRVPTSVAQEIAQHVQDAANKEGQSRYKRAPNLRDYHVQFQGISSGKSRQVKLAGACQVNGATSAMLTRAWLIVHDGGDCYFEAIYDPATKKFLRFMFNGVS